MVGTGLSQRRSCNLTGIERATFRYQPKPEKRPEIRAKLKEIARLHPRFGVPWLTVLLRREFGSVNHKRVERLCREENLSLPRKRPKRKGRYLRILPAFPIQPNERWSRDFVHDRVINCRRVRILNIVDDYTRECVAAIADSSISGVRVKRLLEEIATWREMPNSIMSDNGPEFTSKAMLEWSNDS